MLKRYLKLIFKLNSIMSEVENVEAKIAELKNSVDNLQTRVNTAIAGLQNAVNNGGLSVDDANKLIAEIQVVQDEVDSTAPATDAGTQA